MNYKLKDLVPYLGKLIDLYGGHDNVETRWKNRKYVKILVDIAEDYNNELEKIRENRNKQVATYKKQYNVHDELEKEDGVYPAIYLEKLEDLKLYYDNKIKEVQQLEITIPDDFPKLLIKDVIKIIKSRKLEIYGNDFIKIENFIK